MNVQHRDLAAGRWQSFPLVVQLANVGSEVERALELLGLTTEVKRVERMGGRWVPTQVVFKDALKDGQGTDFVIETIEFNATIPDHVFTKASLR